MLEHALYTKVFVAGYQDRMVLIFTKKLNTGATKKERKKERKKEIKCSSKFLGPN
jgi:hypothetical protein